MSPHGTPPATPLALHAARATDATSPEGDGESVLLLCQLAHAAKVVARESRRAALVGRVGLVGSSNASGDAQHELDTFANRVFVEALAATGLVAGVVSEELEEIKLAHCEGEAPWIVAIDPLDGSSNIDVGGSVGTVFGCYRRSGSASCEALEEELLQGAPPVVAGYVLYGPATVLVYTAGGRVDGFTLDHSVGDFLLSHPDIRCPERGDTYSINVGNSHLWAPAVRSYVEHLDRVEPERGRPYTLRYSGAMVADLHRILLEGGIYLYPADDEHPEGKLRLLYEGMPMACLVEAAGGAGSTGRGRLLEVPRRALHQTVPVALGSRHEVAEYERAVASRDC